MAMYSDYYVCEECSPPISTRSFLDKMMITVRRLPTAVTALLPSFEDVPTSCRQCKGPVRYSQEFCSQDCGMKFWSSLRQKNGKVSGEWLCSLPGCDKKCWIENNGRVHDYCSKSHADAHGKMMYDVQQMQKGGYDTRSRTYGRQNSSGPIYFYDRSAPYYEFTNFYSASIDLDGKVWPTTEHYFQAQKFVGTPYLEVIHRCSSPREAFDFSRKPNVFPWCRKDWDEVKIDVMRKALLAKFGQHDKLRKLLVDTEKRKLVERSPYDSFWGDGGDGSGKNWLGVLLMEIRDNYIKKK